MIQISKGMKGTVKSELPSPFWASGIGNTSAISLQIQLTCMLTNDKDHAHSSAAYLWLCTQRRVFADTRYFGVGPSPHIWHLSRCNDCVKFHFYLCCQPLPRPLCCPALLLHTTPLWTSWCESSHMCVKVCDTRLFRVWSPQLWDPSREPAGAFLVQLHSGAWPDFLHILQPQQHITQAGCRCGCGGPAIFSQARHQRNLQK